MLSWLATRIDLTPEMLRLPALIGGIGTIPLVYLIGTRTVGRGAALLATALTTLSPFMIYYSAEARGYGLMIFLLLGSTLAMLLAVDRGEPPLVGRLRAAHLRDRLHPLHGDLRDRGPVRLGAVDPSRGDGGRRSRPPSPLRSASFPGSRG